MAKPCSLLIFILFLSLSCNKKVVYSSGHEVPSKREIRTLQKQDSLINNSTFKSQKPNKKYNWLNFQYDEAKIYLYGTGNVSGEYFSNSLIIKDNKLNKTISDTSGIKLSKEQVLRFNEVFSGKYFSPDDVEAASCFLPHHGLVFYLQGKPVAHVSICLMCEQLKSFPRKAYFDKALLTKLIRELGLPIFKNPEEAKKYNN